MLTLGVSDAYQCTDFYVKLSLRAWPQGYKTFSMLISTELEILNAHKCKNIEKFIFFQAQISLECYFSCS